MRLTLPVRARSNTWQRRAWLATWLQGRRRGRVAASVSEPEAPVTLLTDLVAYWDGDSDLDATATITLLPEEFPSYGNSGGPGGGPACALGENDFVYSEEEAFFQFTGMTYNVWVNQNEWFGVETLSTRTVDLAQVCIELFVALDMQAVFGGHMYSATDWETPPDWLWFPHAVNPGEWHMWTITMSASRMEYYLDGVWLGGFTKNYPTAHQPTAQFLVKGHHPFGTWSGAWANCGLWHRALDAAEVGTLFNGGDGLAFAEL